MKKNILLYCILCAFVLSCVSKKKHSDVTDQLDSAGQEITYLNDEMDKLREVIAELQFKNDSLENECQQLPQSSGSNNAYIEKLEQEVSSLKSKNDEQNIIIKSYETELENPNIVYETIEVAQPDTLVNSNNIINTNNLAFYCPKKMYKGEAYDAFGLISDVISNDELKKILKKELIDYNPSLSEDDLENEDFIFDELVKADMVKLELVSTNEDMFSIEKVGFHGIREFDSKDNDWHWEVTPEAIGQSQRLRLYYKFYDKNEEEIPEAQGYKIYNIDISVNPKGFIENTKELFVENPEWAWTSIIIPFVTFLYGRFQGKKKNKKEEAES